MGLVRLQISPSLAALVNTEASDWLLLDKEFHDGETLGSVLAGLAAAYSKIAQDSQESEFGDQVMVVLNDTLVPASELFKVKPKDGDTVVLLPTYSGG